MATIIIAQLLEQTISEIFSKKENFSFLDTPLKGKVTGKRCYGRIYSISYHVTVKELITYNDDQLCALRHHGFGKKTLGYIPEILNQINSMFGTKFTRNMDICKINLMEEVLIKGDST